MCAVQLLRVSVHERILAAAEDFLLQLQKGEEAAEVPVLRALLTERLTAAAEQIVALLEETVAEYEDRVERSEREICRQRRLLDAVLKPEVRLHRADSHALESVNLQARRHLRPAVPCDSDGTPVPGDDPQQALLAFAAAVAKDHDYDWHPCPVSLSDVQTVIVCKEEQQEWSTRVKQEEPEAPHIKEEPEEPEPPHIKEEQEELWTSQEGEQLQGLEEADISKLPFPPVPVKSEDDEEKPQSSQLHQSPAVESREVEPLSSSSTHHLKTEADGDHCGGPEPASNLDPDTLLHPDFKDELPDSPEPETDDSVDWNKPSQTQLGLDSVIYIEVPVSDDSYDTDEKPTACSQCGEIFSNKEYLNQHNEIYKGACSYVDPLSCSVCGQRFSQKRSVKQHMKTHTGEKPFRCPVCGVIFSKQQLTRHMRTHTGEKPFMCSVCSLSFSQKGNLKKHMKTHTGEKPFSCPVCGQRFAEKGNMKTHMRTHTGEKPYMCLHCGRKFSSKAWVKRHMRTHWGETVKLTKPQTQQANSRTASGSL